MKTSVPFFVSLSDQNQPYALIFSGQSTPWAEALTQLCDDPDLESRLKALSAASEKLVSPLAAEVLATNGSDIDLFAYVGAQRDSAARGSRAVQRNPRRSSSAIVSVPGILLAQIGAILDAQAAGLKVGGLGSSPISVLGHSQGVLAQRAVDIIAASSSAPVEGDNDCMEKLAQLLAVARIIGLAGTRIWKQKQRPSATQATPMMAIKDATKAQIETLINRVSEPCGPIGIGVRNAGTNFVISGYPQDLERFAEQVEREHRHQAELRQKKVRGGRVFNPTVEYLEVSIPFHSQMLTPAVDMVRQWALECSLDGDRAADLAYEVLVGEVDWQDSVESVLRKTSAENLWFVDLGPGQTAGRLTLALVEGSGAGVVDATTVSAREKWGSQNDVVPQRTQNWQDFAPKVVETAGGKRIETAFTALTGRKPILLAGMTPTTVDPTIVAAAANAGYWAELAGGGQVTEEVFDRHVDALESLLEEGNTVEFNAMFMDRYLWNLQFGSSRIVPKRRASGAPIDGVVISAGIPERDEATALVAELRSEGFPYVAFKPGTVDQIRQVVAIAREVAPVSVIMEIEGGTAGGHHSWESLDDLLISTYAEVRQQRNIVLVAGGGIGTPQRAADYICGEWSQRYGVRPMPVDGVLVGTAVMTAREAQTSPQVKQALVDAPGVALHAHDGSVAPDPFAPQSEEWVPAGGSRGGVASGLSHLHADIYELENSSARAGRLIAHTLQHPEELVSRREEIIAALDATSKPYFGDLEEMTYLEWARRFAELSYPWADPTYVDRFLHLLHRIEARVSAQEKGEFVSLFASAEDVSEPTAALAQLEERYPQAAQLKVTPMDAAWFPTLLREYPKPLPFVPVIDGDLLRWWGQDQLWQSEDPRYGADSVRIIPGPVSVAGITTIDEPVAEILDSFVDATIARASRGERDTDAETETGMSVESAFSALAWSEDAESFIRNSPHISWLGHLTENPAFGSSRGSEQYEIVRRGEDDGELLFDLDLHLDTYWDKAGEAGLSKHAVRHIVIPLKVDATRPERVPVVDRDRLPEHVFSMLAATAGVGNTAITGDEITQLPTIVKDGKTTFGTAHYGYTLSANLGMDHEAVTGAALPEALAPTGMVTDALVGPAWPAIYAALGSVTIDKDFPIIEGLLNAVHLDHLIRLEVPLQQLQEHTGERIDLTSWADPYEESASGRVVTIHVEHRSAQGTLLAVETERFAIRGRAYSDQMPVPAPDFGGVEKEHEDTPRQVVRRVTVRAPHDMTAFARTSGDFNPIHTSYRGAAVSGLKAPLVHGMWLSAVAQHAVEATDSKGVHYPIVGWSYAMYGMVQLDDDVEITVERIGKVRGGGLVLEVSARINKIVVSKATAITAAPVTAYVYPGQGIQQQGMVLDERAASPAARETWERADKLTREKLGFSILAVVRDNPTTLTAHGVTYVHPEGLLNLTQFTQVALATVAFAQTARLREEGVLVEPAYFAGHSLGEYDALSSYAQIIPLETELELVFHRGSTMHHLIERDEQGRSNYRMAALRPNQFGVGDADVRSYVEQVSRESGEFLEIVNYNLAGAQYAIAGTIAGLNYLREDSERRAREFGGKPPFMLVPGIDVPFHSTVLRKGVPEFRDKLDELLPAHIEYGRLVGRYIPNLVAVPFEMTKEFARKILEVVPSERLSTLLETPGAWEKAARDEQKLGRVLLTELLSWQFASPVRWIETQAFLFSDANRGGAGIEQCVEVGVGNAPTLANLASKTVKLPDFSERRVSVYNVGRDAARVFMTDTDSLAVDYGPSQTEQTVTSTDSAVSSAAEVSGARTSTEGTSPAPEPSPSSPQAAAGAEPSVSASAPASAAGSGERPADIPFTAADGIRALIAYSTKIRLDQIGEADTTDTLTHGVSSRRNQLLMDISAELGVASVEGAAEADIAALSKIVVKAAPGYHAFGAVLSDAVRERFTALFGAAGVKAARVKERVTGTWQLGDGWAAWTSAVLLLNTREGVSTRGGDLATLPTETVTTSAKADQLIDAAVAEVAAAHGVSVALPTSVGSGAGAVVDSAALNEFAEKISGEQGVLAASARFVLKELGFGSTQQDVSAMSAEGTGSNGVNGGDDARVVEAVTAELGADWPRLVEPRFDARKVVLFDDRWASAREDLARIYVAAAESDVADMPENVGTHFEATGVEVERQARWYAQRCEKEGNIQAAARFDAIAHQTQESVASDFAGRIAVVTGVSEASIAAQVVARLLEQGATVVATSHSFSSATVQWAKRFYRRHAVGTARLWLVPANLSSYRDIDEVVKWVGEEQKETAGASVTVVKPSYEPDLFFPFAAPAVHGTMNEAGELFESQARLMLWGVERAITGFAAIGKDSDVSHRLHVVLPGSPNRGIFGGDGAYGEVKASFDALVNRSKVEKLWSDRVTLAHPRIGWVRGTGLMKGNDPLVRVVESEGIHTYSAEEMSEQLVQLASEEARRKAAAEGPLSADLTGGLGADPIDMKALWAKAAEHETGTGAQGTHAGGEAPAQENLLDAAWTGAVIKALPTPQSAQQASVTLDEWEGVTAEPKDQVVIVSIGEMGPWGSGRTRWDAELGISSDGSVELSAAGILELAWNMGLLTWQDNPEPGWYDTEGAKVPEEEIAQRYGDEVVARSGIRPFETGMGTDYREETSEEDTSVFLDNEVTFNVPTRELADEYMAADPEHTQVAFDAEQNEWLVTRTKGAMARVPRRAVMSRTVGGQFPTGFDPQKWGIPASMVGEVDPIALWNIVTTVDAYLSAGFTPAEILRSVHPSMVASTQGTGFGGMSSMRKLYLDRFLGKEVPTDILQEALPNVVAAHVMQSYIGGYGSMIQPVSACATAAISLEEGYDKIMLGKADFVVTGAIDDIGVESVNGFGSMNATADSQKMYAKGIDSRFFSRANDRRRGGFLESQGGGTVLLTRGDIALRMGLPVAGVVGYVQSFADGAHTSIPAPGLGAVAAARGGKDSQLVRNLAALGVSPDDIAVVSKHDTSTNANDPNEAELHNVVATAIGRQPGNPLYVVSQKSLTGHAKGGACVFQLNGLTQMFASGVIPANASLDCVDPALRADDYLVWLRQPLHLGAVHTLKAGLATSLGFGHVSGFVALVHPGAFEASVAHTYGEQVLERWREQANEHLQRGARRRERGMMGLDPLFEPIENRRFAQKGSVRRGTDPHSVEIAMLLDPQARLSSTGLFDSSLGKDQQK